MQIKNREYFFDSETPKALMCALLHTLKLKRIMFASALRIEVTIF